MKVELRSRLILDSFSVLIWYKIRTDCSDVGIQVGAQPTRRRELTSQSAKSNQIHIKRTSIEIFFSYRLRLIKKGGGGGCRQEEREREWKREREREWIDRCCNDVTWLDDCINLSLHSITTAAYIYIVIYIYIYVCVCVCACVCVSVCVGVYVCMWVSECVRVIFRLEEYWSNEWFYNSLVSWLLSQALTESVR